MPFPSLTNSEGSLPSCWQLYHIPQLHFAIGFRQRYWTYIGFLQHKEPGTTRGSEFLSHPPAQGANLEQHPAAPRVLLDDATEAHWEQPLRRMLSRCFTAATPSRGMQIWAEVRGAPHLGSRFTSQRALQETKVPPAALVPGNLITLRALKTPQMPSAAGRPPCPCSTKWMLCIFSLRSADSEASHFAEALNSLLKCNLGSILFQLLCSNFNQVLKRKILKNYLKI